MAAEIAFIALTILCSILAIAASCLIVHYGHRTRRAREEAAEKWRQAAEKRRQANENWRQAIAKWEEVERLTASREAALAKTAAHRRADGSR